MLFLAIFGKNVEDAFGPLRYLAFYFAGGFVATMTQTAMTLLFATAHAAQVPNLGASGAIAAVLGAYFALYPGSQILTWVFFFLVRVPAWIYLGLWFCTSSSRRTSGCSAPGRTGAASRSSLTSAGSSSACW
jgi:membrane associated rhomboid family serine protease